MKRLLTWTNIALVVAVASAIVVQWQPKFLGVEIPESKITLALLSILAVEQMGLLAPTLNRIFE
ncbi:MAG TPA: hypothetical protein VD902_00760 [Symbiobacteriaceae bacterium]|nr:hypothetical protein [Symbiobacteriaceae bacterium]